MTALRVAKPKVEARVGECSKVVAVEAIRAVVEIASATEFVRSSLAETYILTSSQCGGRGHIARQDFSLYTALPV